MTGLARNVVITGMGVVSAIGLGVDNFWHALCAGTPGVSEIASFDASQFTCKAAGEIKNAAASPFFKTAFELNDRVTQLALLAANEAIAQARLDATAVDRAEFGTFVGTGVGGVHTHEHECSRFVEGHRVHPAAILKVMYNAPAGQISALHKFEGPSVTVTTACASGSQAIGEAFEAIRRGAIPLAIAGGTEAPLSKPLYAAWSAMRVMSRWDGAAPGACRPFSLDRSGLVLGEGAAFFVLEAEPHAIARGATILGRLRSYASNTTISHPTTPDVAPEVKVMQRALKAANLLPRDISFVSAHGTGTPANDATETRALQTVFGDDAARLKISSAKAQLGHTLGAAGALGLAAGVLALRHRIAPPTINLQTPDPACPLNYVALHAQALDRDGSALINAFGFGGTNVALVVEAAT